MVYFLVNYLIILRLLIVIIVLLYIYNKLGSLTWHFSYIRLLTIISFFVLLFYTTYVRLQLIGTRRTLSFDLLLNIDLNLILNIISINNFLLIIIYMIILSIYIKFVKISFQSLHYLLQIDGLCPIYKTFVSKMLNYYIDRTLCSWIRFKLKLTNKYYNFSSGTITEKLQIIYIVIIILIILEEVILNNKLYNYYVITSLSPIILFIINIYQFYTVDHHKNLIHNVVNISLYNNSKAEYYDIVWCKYVKNVQNMDLVWKLSNIKGIIYHFLHID